MFTGVISLFAVLNILERPSDFRSRFAARRQPREPVFVTVPVKCAAPFFIVSVYLRDGVIPWDSVARLAGGCADKLLLPDGVSVPESCPVKPFVPTLYPRRVLANTAISMLSLMHLPPKEVRLCLIDPCANLTACLTPLIRLCGTVKVITRRAALFDAAAADIYTRFGAVVLVTDYRDTPHDSNIIIDCSGEAELRGDAVMFSTVLRPGEVLCGKDFTLPDYYTRLLPDGIQPFNFAAALCELCGVGELGTAEFDTVTLNGEVLSLSAAAEKILLRRHI